MMGEDAQRERRMVDTQIVHLNFTMPTESKPSTTNP